MSNAICDTDALCQGRTGTCWYVATVTFMWKSQDFLRDECGIEFSKIIKQFLRFTVGQCDSRKAIGPGAEKCLMLPPGVEREYMKQRHTKVVPNLKTGGFATDLLMAFLSESAVSVFYIRLWSREWMIKHAFREYDVVAIDRPPSSLGFAEVDPQMTAASGAIMMIGMMAEAKDTPKSHVLVGAFVRVRHPGSGHVVAIVRCKKSATQFMICDSKTGQCYDGARERTFDYGKFPGTIKVVSFVYARRKALFTDIALR